VFLSGVRITDVSVLTPKEQHFLDLLAARLPEAAIVLPAPEKDRPAT
jgi:hypothetical protein